MSSIKGVLAFLCFCVTAEVERECFEMPSDESALIQKFDQNAAMARERFLLQDSLDEDVIVLQHGVPQQHTYFQKMLARLGERFGWEMHESMALLEQQPMGIPFALGLMGSWCLFLIVALKDLVRVLTSRRDLMPRDVKHADKAEKTNENWSLPGLVALTSYRFYTGFLSATWLPYLLAMEGQDLWQEEQALFMGVAKLIYGTTILLNPIFGLCGDKVTMVSHAVGRRLFVCLGVVVASCGILMCIHADRLQRNPGKNNVFSHFVAGILLWRIGEALNDVTTEALVPEVVPKAQYQLASAVKSTMFLIGGLLGYWLLIVFAHVHYSWLYYAYLAGMFTFSLPCLLLLTNDAPGTDLRRSASNGFWGSLYDAYVLPTQYRGGFGRACLAVFLFSLGTAPMFFLLLILRDLVGITEQTQLQENFSASSICFFLSAATASVQSALGSKLSPEVLQGLSEEDRTRQERELHQRKVRVLIYSCLAFGVVVLLIPALALFPSTQARQRGFFALSIVFGASFGAAFSRFQDCTWSELPPEAVMANAMGFNVMSRLFGLGLGNLVAGLLLDQFYTGETAHTLRGTLIKHPAVTRSLLNLRSKATDAEVILPKVYQEQGYWWMCVYCSIVVFASTWVAWDGLKRKSLHRSSKHEDQNVDECVTSTQPSNTVNA